MEDLKASVIFCDDIRQEATGKFLLIGVYASEIIFYHAPASINISTYIQMTGLSYGRHHVFSKVILQPEGEPSQIIGTIEVDVDITKPEFAASIAPTGLPVSCDRNGVITVHLTIDNGPEFLAGSIGVTINQTAA